MTSINAYDTLYENLKNRFTVQNDNSECTLGEYMLAKAQKNTNKSSLPVAVRDYTGGKLMLQSLVSYVNEKLTIKKAPVKDKTMEAFPLRTSLASIFSALLVCTLVVTYGLAGAKNTVLGDSTADATPSYAIDSYRDDAVEDEIYEAYKTVNI